VGTELERLRKRVAALYKKEGPGSEDPKRRGKGGDD
jgi:hypothetical protein